MKHPFFKARGVALAGLIILSACSAESSGQSPAKGSGKGPAVPVTAAAAVQKAVPVKLRAIGNVQAYSTVVIKAQVEGTLVQVFFKEGREVAKGDLLFTLDSRPFESQLRQAEANLARDQAQTENARQQVRRYEQLLQKEYVSQEQYDQLRATASAFEGTLQADQAAVEQAKLQLEYASIRSPIDGVTGNLLVHPGNLIKANDADHPLVTINQIRPIYVVFSVPEKNLSEIRKHRAGGSLAVEASVPNGSGPGVQGQLTFVDNAVNTTTGTIQLKALFPNESRFLWPGQFVNVALTLNVQPSAIVVPSQAIQTGQQGSYVFVVKSDQTVEMRPVAAGLTVEGETVVDRGISAGETVVTDGQLRLAPGVKVEVKSAVTIPPGPEKAPEKSR